jgi:hypothetical protein
MIDYFTRLLPSQCSRHCVPTKCYHSISIIVLLVFPSECSCHSVLTSVPIKCSHHSVPLSVLISVLLISAPITGGRRDRMVVGFTTSFAIGAYHH